MPTLHPNEVLLIRKGDFFCKEKVFSLTYGKQGKFRVEKLRETGQPQCTRQL